MTYLADSPSELPYLCANHASLFFWLHGKILPQKQDRLQPLSCELIKQPYLRRIFQNHLQAKFWMVLDVPCELNVFSFIVRWIDFSPREFFQSRCEYDAGKRGPGRTEVEKVSVALGGMAHTINPPSNLGPTPGMGPNPFNVGCFEQGNVRFPFGGRVKRRVTYRVALAFIGEVSPSLVEQVGKETRKECGNDKENRTG